MSNGTGAAANEAAAVQPVSLRQGRGNRLSFLGGRKKEQTNGETTPHINGETETDLSRSKSVGKDSTHRRSFFRSHAADPVPPPTPHQPHSAGVNGANGANDASDWVTDSAAGGRESSDLGLGEKDGGPGGFAGSGTGSVRMGSVRKRLSLLKLGKKSSKGNGVMGSLDEE